MPQLTESEWLARLALAEQLRKKEAECAMCGGTGGWPGLMDWTPCVPCAGSGSNLPANPAVN